MIQIKIGVDMPVYESFFSVRIPWDSVLPIMLTVKVRARLTIVTDPVQNGHVPSPFLTIEFGIIVYFHHGLQCRMELRKTIS